MRSPHSKADLDMWRRYGAALDRLRAAVPPGTIVLDPPTARAILGALRGMGGDAWREFDERSGYNDAETWRFALVRQMRNSPYWARLLLDAVNEPERLTLAWVRAHLAERGLTIRRTGNGSELVVRLKGSPPGHGHFTDDLRDALDTGRAMAAYEASRGWLDGPMAGTA